jgi:hypothetical protein
MSTFLSITAGGLEGVSEFMTKLEKVSRLPYTALVNNTHLMRETTRRIISEGASVVEELSRLKGLPKAFTGVLAELLESGKMAAEEDDAAGDDSLPLAGILIPEWIAFG